MMAGRLFWAILALVLASSAVADAFSVNENLPPAEQYRRLGLVLLIGEAVDEALYRRLQETHRGAPVPETLDPDRLKSPLLRIVDQPSMLAGTAHLFRIAREHGAEVAQGLRDLAARHPGEVSKVGYEALREDAILVRMAVADSIEFAGLGDEPDLRQALQDYRARTVELRDLLEFEAFDLELQRLTAEAIAAVGSQMDAYQRMFEDEVRDDAFEHHVRTAERPYLGRGEVNENAARLAEEVMDSVVLSESRPDP